MCRKFDLKCWTLSPSPSTDMSGVSGASDMKVEEELKKRKAQEEAQAVAEALALQSDRKFPERYWENKCCKIQVPYCWDQFVFLCGTVDPQSK